MSEFTTALDLRQVSQLFQILGTSGAIEELDLDDISFVGGGVPLGR